MAASFHQTIASDAVSLHVLMEDVTAFLEKHGVDARAIFQANLGIEELVTNTIKYGYDVPGSHPIEVRVKVEADDVALTIIDNGRAFNPITYKSKPVAEKSESPGIGGLGIPLLKKQFYQIEYRREAGRNIVDLRARRDAGLP